VEVPVKRRKKREGDNDGHTRRATTESFDVKTKKAGRFQRSKRGKKKTITSADHAINVSVLTVGMMVLVVCHRIRLESPFPGGISSLNLWAQIGIGYYLQRNGNGERFIWPEF